MKRERASVACRRRSKLLLTDISPIPDLSLLTAKLSTFSRRKALSTRLWTTSTIAPRNTTRWPTFVFALFFLPQRAWSWLAFSGVQSLCCVHIFQVSLVWLDKIQCVKMTNDESCFLVLGKECQRSKRGMTREKRDDRRARGEPGRAKEQTPRACNQEKQRGRGR